MKTSKAKTALKGVKFLPYQADEYTENSIKVYFLVNDDKKKISQAMSKKDALKAQKQRKCHVQIETRWVADKVMKSMKAMK